MKTVFYSFALCLLSLGACSSYQSTSIEPDDRYFTLADARKEQRQLKKLAEQAADTPGETPVENYKQYKDETPATEQSAEQNGSTYVTNNYYDMDDYYDYMYASRIRRFHQPYYNSGYYSPYYTNMYWYNYDPFFFGTSIYTTYSFFNPYVPWGYNHWSPGWNIGWNSWSGMYFNYGWGWSNPWNWSYYGYNPHFSPFYYNPWACHPYSWGMSPWSHGYMQGYNMALYQQNYTNNQIYYNSYDQNTYVAPVVQKPQTGGFGAGPNMIKPSPTLAQTFSKEIGSAPTAQVKAPTSQKPSSGVSKPNALKPNATVGTTAAPVPNAVSGQTKPGASNQINAPAVIEQPGSIKSQAGKYNSVKEATTIQSQSIQNPNVAGKDAFQQKNTNQQLEQAPNQKGKEGLIQSGFPQNQAPSGQYNSVPAKGQQQGRFSGDGNSLQQPNINMGNPQIKQTERNSTTSPAPYTPSYDYNRALPAEGNQPAIRQQPSTAPGGVKQGYDARQAPQYNAPVQQRAPSREYYQQPRQQEPAIRQQRNEMNGNNRFQAPAERQFQQNQTRPSAPSRSFDRAPSNNNIGGGSRGFGNGGGGNQNRTNSIRK